MLIIILVIILIIICFFIFIAKTKYVSSDFSTLQFKQNISEDFKPAFDYNPETLKRFFNDNKQESALVEIINNRYRIHTSDASSEYIMFMKELLQNLVDTYELPNCIFVQWFGDQNISSTIPVFQNSINFDQVGILSPFWFFFSRTKIDKVKQFHIPWSQKMNKAVFRGATTGIRVTHDFGDDTAVSRKYIVNLDGRTSASGIEIDAKFTKNTLKDTKIDTSPDMSIEDQLKYKYIISADGNGGTNGLYWVLCSGSVPVLSIRHKQWFSKFFTEGRDYVKFSDKSNSTEDLTGAIDNISFPEKMADRCRRKGMVLFTYEHVLEYYRLLIEKIAEKQIEFANSAFT